MNMSLMELYHSMGWFAKGIVYTLLAMSAFSFTVLISKWCSMMTAAVVIGIEWCRRRESGCVRCAETVRSVCDEIPRRASPDSRGIGGPALVFSR